MPAGDMMRCRLSLHWSGEYPHQPSPCLPYRQAQGARDQMFLFLFSRRLLCDPPEAGIRLSAERGGLREGENSCRYENLAHKDSGLLRISAVLFLQRQRRRKHRADIIPFSRLGHVIKVAVRVRIAVMQSGGMTPFTKGSMAAAASFAMLVVVVTKNNGGGRKKKRRGWRGGCSRICFLFV